MATDIIWTLFRGRRRRLLVRDIDVIHAQQKYVALIHAEGGEYLVETSIKRLMRAFPGQWVEINRGTAVRWSLVRGAESVDGEMRILVREREWPVSRRRVRFVRALLERESREWAYP